MQTKFGGRINDDAADNGMTAIGNLTRIGYADPFRHEAGHLFRLSCSMILSIDHVPAAYR